MKMLNKYRFSIITVVYNDPLGLEKTIKSVLSQRFLNFQYIIIDGNSKDQTKKILKKYEKKIDRILSEPDKGIYYAMNKGLKLSEGKGIIFLNAGDIFVGQILSNRLSIPSLINVYYKKKNCNLKKKNYSFYKFGMPYCHQGIVFENKNIFYNTEIKISSDYDFYLRYKYKNSLKFSRVDGYINYGNDGISAKQHKIRDKEASNIIKKNFGNFWCLTFSIKTLIKSFLKRILF